MCEHLRMDPKDDPEARIRELERTLSERASELGAGQPPTRQWPQPNFPPPPAGPPAPWPGYADPAPRRSRSAVPILLVLVGGLGLIATLGITAYHLLGSSGSTRSDTTTSRSTMTLTAVPGAPTGGPSTSTPAPNETVTVSGIAEHRTIECDGNAVIVSGIENNLTLNGHCNSVSISGIQNIVTVESVNTIGVSGFDNHVTYRTGEPQINKSGKDNTVEQG